MSASEHTFSVGRRLSLIHFFRNVPLSVMFGSPFEHTGDLAGIAKHAAQWISQQNRQTHRYKGQQNKENICEQMLVRVLASVNQPLKNRIS